MLNLQPPTFEEFLSETQRGNSFLLFVPSADLQTPVGAFMRIRGIPNMLLIGICRRRRTS